LLRLQHELEGSCSEEQEEALRGRIVRASAQIGGRAGRIAREEAPPKGQDALAAANYSNAKNSAADLAAILGELSEFRASFEAEAKANRALGREILGALVSFPFLLLFSMLTCS
jgi:hypothetical protein